MKREILFKGKRVDNGEWVEGSLINRPEHYAENIKEYCAIVIFDKGSDSSYDAYLELEVHPETVCQFTGLTDKNGKKIFEGDKIIFDSPKIKQVVEYRKGQFMAKQIGTFGSYIGLGYCDWEKHAEIIGNVHD